MDPILKDDDAISIEDDPEDMKMDGKGKKGNKRSKVWDHFKIRGDEKAECNYCGQTYKYHSKNCGTSTLWNHLTQLCKKYPYRVQDKKQKRMTSYSTYKTGKLSKERLKRFKESCEEANIESQALLCLDVTTRWNFTYLMLQAVMKFKKAFIVLESYGNYTNYFNEDRSEGRYINGPPTRVDWDQAEVFVRFLRSFYETTLKFSGSKYVTSNSFFQEICEIHGELNELAKEPNTLMGSMAISMRKKYDKYWGNVEKFNQLLFIAKVLDPRCKLKLLKVGFELIYDAEIVKMLLKRVEETLYRLYACYREMATPVTSSSSSSKETTKSSSSSHSQPILGLSTRIPSIFKARLLQNMQSEKNDLVDYLSDRCEDLTDPNFNILLWWKLNGHKYKIISQIAKDVLAIQISTVASESAFSTSGRILDSFRSSLGAKIVEVLICTKNWLYSSKEPIVLRQYLDEVEALDVSKKAVEEAESCVTTGDIDPIIVK